MGDVSDTFSLVHMDDGENSLWSADVTLRKNIDPAIHVAGEDSFHLAVENDCEASGDTVFLMSDFPAEGSVDLRADIVQTRVRSFDLDSVRSGNVVYVCKETFIGPDRFSFQTPSNPVARNLKFSLFRLSHQLHLKQCSMVEVAVGQSVSLGKNMLEAISPANRPDDVLFTASRPHYGHLIFKSQSNAAVEVSSFSQAMVNDGQVIYQHAGDTPGLDYFRFNVVDRNGSTVGDRKFRIKIIG